MPQPHGKRRPKDEEHIKRTCALRLPLFPSECAKTSQLSKNQNILQKSLDQGQKPIKASKPFLLPFRFHPFPPQKNIQNKTFTPLLNRSNVERSMSIRLLRTSPLDPNSPRSRADSNDPNACFVRTLLVRTRALPVHRTSALLEG